MQVCLAQLTHLLDFLGSNKQHTLPFHNADLHTIASKHTAFDAPVHKGHAFLASKRGSHTEGPLSNH
jgi:hypothetical protein